MNLLLHDRNLMRLLRMVKRHMTAQITDIFATRGYAPLTARHLQIFENLSHETNSIVQMAHQAGISKQAMGKLLKEVEGEGYVQTVTDKHDSRVQRIFLTEKGERFMADMFEQIRKYQLEFVFNKIISDTELETVMDTFTKILTHYEAEEYRSLNVKHSK